MHVVCSSVAIYVGQCSSADVSLSRVNSMHYVLLFTMKTWKKYDVLPLIFYGMFFVVFSIITKQTGKKCVLNIRAVELTR